MSDLADYCGKVGYEVPLHQNAADFALDVITPDARGARRINRHRRSTHRSMNAQVSPTYYAMANLVIRGFIDEGNDNTESITNGVGFRNDISYGSIAPPVTYVLFAAFIILMKAATVFAMRGLKQAK